MFLELLPNELIVQIMQSTASVRDTLHFAETCHRFQHVLSSRRVPILAAAAEAQHGPLIDAIQVATYNSSQPAHLIRDVPLSVALIKQLHTLGKVAQKWIDVFPMRKWKDNYADRRLLTQDECYRIRRAIYRIWLYSKAFHNDRYKRTTRLLRQHVLERADLLHNWNSEELAEIEDIRQIVRDFLGSQVCPSNGSIQRRFRKRHPDSNQQLLFNCNIHLNYPPPSEAAQTPMSYAAALAGQKPSPAQVQQLSGLRYQSNAWHNAGDEGWGDDIPHYYVLEDMLKLDPGEIMWLRDNAPLKGMVQTYVRNHGEWFENNGETFGQTLKYVLDQRGEDLEDVKDAIMEHSCGIIVD